jgi:hypothetical protein
MRILLTIVLCLPASAMAQSGEPEAPPETQPAEAAEEAEAGADDAEASADETEEEGGSNLETVLDEIQDEQDAEAATAAAAAAAAAAADAARAAEEVAPIVIRPANLHEPVAVSERRPPQDVIVIHEEEEGWDPEVEIWSGLYVQEGIDAGFFLGLSFAVVEQGPQTRSEYVIADHYARRAVWNHLDLSFGVNPGNGLDETTLVLGIRGTRTEVETGGGAESGTSEIFFGPARFERSLAMEREADITVSLVEGYADRRFAIREGASVHVLADVGAAGFNHIQYTPLNGVDHFFNGVRALSLDVTIAPEFALGESGSNFRYIAGLAGDIAIGARDGGLLTVHSDLKAESGVGGDITEWVSWSALIGYRGAVDSRRDNRSGWYSNVLLRGRIP